jgi:integrase
MPSIDERKNSDGSRSYVAQVRVKPFTPSSRTFHQRDFPSRKDALKAAETWAEEQEKTLREQRVGGAVRKDIGSLKFRDLAAEYLADPKTKALATYDERCRQIGWWTDRCGSMRALEFPSPVVIREAREVLLGAFDAGTVNRYLAAVRTCVNFSRAAGLLPPNIVWPPKLMLREPKGRERFLTDEELDRVREAARAESPLMYAAVMFAIGVGCRQSEQLRVRWADIDEVSETVAIRVSKSDTSRRTHIPPAVVAALKALYQGNVRPHPTAYVFVHDVPIEWVAWAKLLGTSLGKLRVTAKREALTRPTEVIVLKAHELIDRWERIRVAAGVPDVRWHDLRHASASFLIQNGSSLAEVAHQLGHKNVATAKRYAHLVPGAKPTGADALNKKLNGG